MQAISAYQALFFDEVAAAVDFCDRLVSFVVPRAGGRPHAAGNPAVWFHVPPRSTRTTRDGCYLFLSPGAVAAAEAAGVATAADLSGAVPRAALPPGSVLVLGEDLADVPAARAPHAAAPERRLPGSYTPPAGTATPRSA